MKQLRLDIHSEIIVDNFAGGGGASTGIELAIGRRVDVAINHDPEAVAMHTANHPETEHHCESVWDVDPRTVKPGRPIGLLWLSPDCKHFSKAKGGKPVEKKIRALAWVALRWAALRQPRVIMLENVEEFVTWGPLVEDAEGRMRPCPKRKGREFNAFRNALQRHGYAVEWRELRACDYGAPTIRKRLFLIARRDGRPIVWPAPTHGDPKSEAVKSGRLKPWRTAAECIDWSLPTPSIFERAKPLADATCRRIAKGIVRYVVEAAEPFIVRVDQASAAKRNGVASLEDPLRTICTSGGMALVAPYFSTYYGANRPGGDRTARLDEPLRTQSTENRFALVSAFLTKYHGESAGSGMPAPFPTITANSFHKRPGGNPPLAVATAFLAKHYGGVVGSDLRAPIGTVTSVDHHSLVRAFLIKYYGTDQDPRLEEPLHTVTTKDRYGLVTVAGEEYAIADIGLRMLAPRELFRAQGFPEHYIIGDDPAQGLSLTKTAQVRMCGNSVCPPLATALVSANLSDLAIERLVA